MNNARVVALIFIYFGLGSCSLFATNDNFGKSWTGAPFERLERVWGPPAEAARSIDGNTEMRYELFNGSCTYVFKVDQSGKIIGYRWKTNGYYRACVPIG